MGGFAKYIPAILALVTQQYWYAAILFATAVAGDYQQRRARRKARDAFNAGLEDRLVMTATADAARSRVYGRVRNVDGVVFKATHGEHKQFYTLVIALAGHQIDAIEAVFFNELEVSIDANGYVQTPPYSRNDNSTEAAVIFLSGGSGSVVLPNTPIAETVYVVVSTGQGDAGGDTLVPFTISGNTVAVTAATFPTGQVVEGFGTVFYQHTVNTSYARVRKYLGGFQDISNELEALVPTLAVSGQHRFFGMARLLVTLEYTEDAFPSGVPNITARIRGAQCYDWRTATQVWTENPAVIAYDWATYEFGGGLATTEVDIASFTAAANACDVETVFSTKFIQDGDEIVPTDTVAPRYRCGIVAKTDSSAGDVFEEIVQAMAGQHGWQSGLLRIRAGAWRAPVATITEDWISDADSQSIDPAPGVQDTINILRPRISDASKDYVVTPMPEVRAEAYITSDGQELPAEISLSAVTEPFRAIDICEVMMLEGRQALATSLPCKFHAFQLELFDVVEVVLPHYGWASKLFELRATRFGMQSGVIPLLREVSAASYDPATLFTLDDLADNTELPKPWQIDPVEGFAVTSGASLDGLQIVTRTLATWLPHTQAAVLQNGRIEIQYLGVGFAPRTVQWIDQNGDVAIWQDDNGTGVEWIIGSSTVPVLLEWVNNLGPMTWTNDVETTLEWYTEIGISTIPDSDWSAHYEPGGSTSYVIVGLAPRQAYLFRVRAINSAGVRSAWSSLIGIVIPSQPLMQTQGLEIGAATELVTQPVPSDVYTTPDEFIVDRILGAMSYLNDTGADVDIEFTLTSQRRVVTPWSTTNLDVLAYLYVLDTPITIVFGGSGPVQVGPPPSLVNHIEDMGPSDSIVFNESVTWEITLADGHMVDTYSGVRLYQGGGNGGVVLTTSNLNPRMTIIKR